MTAYHLQSEEQSQAVRKLTVLGLVFLPIVAALVSLGEIAVLEIPQVLISGVFPIALTAVSWGLAIKMGLKLRK